MTLADTRPAIPASAVTHAFGRRSLSPTQLEMMRAFFCEEFEIDRSAANQLPEPTPTAVAEWVDALTMSGLFAPSELNAMSDAWFTEPHAVVALLSGVDEVTARREIAEVATPSVEYRESTRYLRAS